MQINQPNSQPTTIVRIADVNSINQNVSSTYKSKIIQPNVVNGVNVLTQDMINQSNTKYIIKYDFELAEDINIPDGCILEFDGGSFSNGLINGNKFSINGEGQLNRVEILGGCKFIDGALFIPKSATKTSGNASQLQLFIKSTSNCNAHAYFSDKRSIGIESRIYLYSNIDIDFTNTTIYKLDRYANFRTIGMYYKTYNTENILIKNITFRNERDIRHDCFELVGVKNLTVDGFDYYDLATTQTDSQGNRTSAWATRISGENILIKNIKIRNYPGAGWTDGIHLERCKNVEIYNFDIKSGDDCIAIHDQLGQTQWTGGYIPETTENVIIHDGICQSNTANIIRIGCESSTPNTFYISDVVIQDIVSIKGDANTFCEIRDYRESGATVYNKNVLLKNISAECAKTEYNSIHITRTNIGCWENIVFDSVSVMNTGNDEALFYIDGASSVTFKNCTFTDTPNNDNITPRISYIKSVDFMFELCQLNLSGGITLRVNNLYVNNCKIIGNNLRQAMFLIDINDYLYFNNNNVIYDANSILWNNGTYANKTTAFITGNNIHCTSLSTLYFLGSTLNKPLYNKAFIDNNYYDVFVLFDTFASDIIGNIIIAGTTSNRPVTTQIGKSYLDITLGKPIWWNGTAWVDATGTAV